MINEAEYEELARKATRQTVIYSSVKQIIQDPSVQSVIKIDTDALPFLFRDLSENKQGVHWRMVAISIILANNDLPCVDIPEEFRGRVKEMIRVYIEYGKSHKWI